MRREALWALKGLRDEPLPLFAALSEREGHTIQEVYEPKVALNPMTAGGEVVEDYNHVGLTLRQHPLAFLRADLTERRIVTCAAARDSKDGKYVQTAGLVLVRQMPGSAHGVVFITMEDETGVVNVIVWPKLYEECRRIILASSMMMVSGFIQREGDVVHLIARSVADLSGHLASIGDRDSAFPLPHGRGDEFHHGHPGPDRQGAEFAPRQNVMPRHLQVKSRNFQ